MRFQSSIRYRFLGGAANSGSFLTPILIPARSYMRPAAELPLKRNVAKRTKGTTQGFQSRAQLGESRDISSVDARNPKKYDGFHRTRRIRVYRSPNVKMNPVEAISPFWVPLFPVTRLGKVVST